LSDKMMVKRCLLLVGCAVGLSPANAQDFQVFVDSGISSSIAAIANANTQAAINREARPSARPSTNKTNNFVAQQQQAQTPKAALTSLLFTPSLATRQRNMASFISKSRAQSAEGGAELEQLLTSTDIFGVLGNAMRPYGLRIDNVADAYAVYWIAAWEASRGITTSTETRTRMQSVKQQAANSLLTTREFVNATPAQKQEMAEAMLIQAYMIAGFINGAKSNPQLMRQLSASVSQGAKAMGLDLSTMTLTEQGFKYTGKIGAVDESTLPATPDAPAQQLALAPAPAENDNTTQYALIAAAGGAGLAGVFLAGKAMGKKW
jgi:hypothetical protein